MEEFSKNFSRKKFWKQLLQSDWKQGRNCIPKMTKDNERICWKKLETPLEIGSNTMVKSSEAEKRWLSPDFFHTDGLSMAMKLR